MLYQVLRRTIERGNFDLAEIQEKLDVFYAVGRIIQDEYSELVGMLQN